MNEHHCRICGIRSFQSERGLRQHERHCLVQLNRQDPQNAGGSQEIDQSAGGIQDSQNELTRNTQPDTSQASQPNNDIVWGNLFMRNVFLAEKSVHLTIRSCWEGLYQGNDKID